MKTSSYDLPSVAMDSAAVTPSLNRQLQKALLPGAQNQQLLMAPVVRIQQTSVNDAQLAPQNAQATVQISSGAEIASTKESTPEYSYKVKIINPPKRPW